jgi:hypothetical protein
MTAPVIADRSSYEAAVAQLRAQLVAYLGAFWATADLTDDTVARLLQIVAPVVAAGQLQMANLTSIYLAAATGTDPLPVADAVTQGRGVATGVVYARPVIQARSLVSKGKAVSEALKAGGLRLESLGTTDLQMAKVRQADASLSRAGVEHFRRVPKGATSCALCLIASTKRYNVGTLAPIHPGCSCGVDVIPPGEALDEVINPTLLEATHQQVKELTDISDRSGRAVDYRKVIITHQHGEIGPVLSWRDQKFTGPTDLDN